MILCVFLFPAIFFIAIITIAATLFIFKNEKKRKLKASVEGEKIDKMLEEGKVSENEANDLKRAVGAYSVMEDEKKGDNHLLVTGILHVVYGAMGTLLIILLSLLLFLRFSNVSMKPVGPGSFCCQQQEFALGGIGLIIILTTMLALAIFFLFELISGILLTKKKSWARYAIIGLSIFIIFSFPIGTAIGIYSLWVLLFRENAICYFE
jgi:hypothetical protein